MSYKDELTNIITDSNSNTNNCGIVNAEIAVPLKYLSN